LPSYNWINTAVVSLVYMLAILPLSSIDSVQK
jgi:hypothetical protein